jgi:nicotinamide riboside kinase
MKPLVINLLAGPGAGKSSTMAAVFSQLKWNGVNAEMAPEYAKEKVWEESLKTLENQIYIFGKQNHRVARLASQVECIITDSPLILSLIYGHKMSKSFKDLVLEEFNRYENLNIFLTRIKPYNPKGRVQTEDKARQLDVQLRELLKTCEVPFVEFPGQPDTENKIVQMALEILKKS